MFIRAQQQSAEGTAFHWRLLGAIATVEYAISATHYADDPTVNPSAKPSDRPADRPADKRPPTGIDGALLLTADHHLKEPWNSDEMQRQHPYADIKPQLAFSSPIAVWRENLRIHVGNTPAVIEQPPQPTTSPTAA